ncbi:3-phosphoshikimate 1-carboxyvinyltransferase [Paenibacillus tarimensis]
MNDNAAHEPDLAARSPWALVNDKQIVEIVPSAGAIEGTITVPGSKSLTNRALIIAAMAEGTSRLEGLLKSDDSYWCINSLRKLGIEAGVEGDTAIIRGCGGQWPVREAEIYTGASGTLSRFLPGALAAGRGNWRLKGSRRMSERPLAPLLTALAGQGAVIQHEETDGALPFTLQANGLHGGEAVMSGSLSSQFISGLVMAAPYAQSPLTVRIDGEVVQRDYVDMTLEMMSDFGVHPAVLDDGQTIAIPNGVYQARNYRLEPDVSTCCYFWALAALTNGRVRIEGITPDTRQPDIELLDVLSRMGCTIKRGNNDIEVLGTDRLQGGMTISMKKWSDQTLTMAVLAVFADGPVTLTDAAHIRHHECDRISAICTELRKLGIRAEEHADGVTVHPGQPQPALLNSYDDHRMAMALSLIGVRAPGIRIADPGCVSKTCPDYFDRLSELGVKVV